MKSLLTFLIISILFIGCGYKPSSYYAKKSIEGYVYVSLDVDIDNSENSVYIKDAMNEMILNQFNANLTDIKSTANTFVMIKLSKVNHTSISSDNDGYAQSYRTSVEINVTYKKIGQKLNRIKVSDYYDYSVDTDSVITDQKKKIAVKKASVKALSNLFSRIAVNSIKE